jgi:hypothetical protein
MDEQSAEKTPARTSPRDESSRDKDLSKEIELAVACEPLDLVKCVRVFDNYYRCNWWTRADDTRQEHGWTAAIVGSIRKSRFLSATMDASELIIKEIGPVGSSNLSARLKK